MKKKKKKKKRDFMGKDFSKNGTFTVIAFTSLTDFFLLFYVFYVATSKCHFLFIV